MAVRFKAAATIISNLSKSNSAQNNSSRKKVILKLEDSVDAYHSTPPHNLASTGDLDALQDSIEVFGLTLRERDRNKATLLHHASKACQLSVMQFLIENGVELDAVDESGNTALHLAAMACDIDGINLLLQSGASSDLLNHERNALLHLAAKDMSGHSLKACLSHPINVHIRGQHNRSVLHILCETDNVEGYKVMNEFMKVQQLNNSTENLKISDNDGFTPIHLAAKKNAHRVLEHIFICWKEMGQSAEVLFDLINESKNTPLQIAVNGGNYEVACILLKYGANPTVLKDGMSPPLHLACSLGHLDIVKAMVQYAGIEIFHMLDHFNRTPLHFSAISMHSTSIISYILEKNQGVLIDQQDSKGNTPLHVSICSGNLDSVKELLARGSDPLLRDKSGSNALHQAVLHNRVSIISELLKVPNSIQLLTDVNSKGYTPIHIALKLGLGDVVLDLNYPVPLQCPSHSVYVKDPYGNNYIHLAAASGNWKLLLELLSLPNVQKLLNDTNHNGMTPLHCAAKKGKSQCIEYLLNYGAINRKGYRGITPLMIACSEGHINCAELLFKDHTYQLNLQDDFGDTALHHATKSGNPCMIQYLLDINSKILHNDSGESFFDLIIQGINEDCGLAVVNHKRWQECLDVISPVRDAPMLRLVKRMPAVANAVLDRCYVQERSSYGTCHSEVFQFTYLLCLEDSHLIAAERNEPATDSPPVDEFDEFNMGDDHNIVSNQRTIARKSLLDARKKNVSHTMEVLRTMVQYKRVTLLVHPVVIEYIRMKWMSYGWLIFGLYFLFSLFNVIFLTSFVVFGSDMNSLNENSSILNLEQNMSNNATSVSNYLQINTTGQVLRILAVLSNFTAAIVVVALVVGYLKKRIDLSHIYDPLFCLITSLLIFIFLFHPNPFEVNFLPVGAVACLLSWLVLLRACQFFHSYGIYVRMYYRILYRVFEVLLISFILLLSFAVPLFLLGRSITEFSNLGYSLFSVFGYMLGEVQYSLFIENTGTHPVFLIVIVTVLAVMLTIVMANLLIGLAVGDIEEIKKNALYDSRSTEISLFDHIDENLPNYLHRKVVNLFVIPNDENLPRCHHRKVVSDSCPKWCHKGLVNSMKILSSEVSNSSNMDDSRMMQINNAVNIPIDIPSELVQIKKKLQELSNIIHSSQGVKEGNFSLRNRRVRWQMPQSSSISLNSTFSEI